MNWRPRGLVGSEVVDLHDVWVDQARGGQRLAPEARDEVRVGGEVLGEQLDGDVALESRVERELHGRHPAHAETTAEAVAAGEKLIWGVAHSGLSTPPGAPGSTPPLGGVAVEVGSDVAVGLGVGLGEGVGDGVGEGVGVGVASGVGVGVASITPHSLTSR